MKKILAYAHQLIEEAIESSAITVDATCGNGHDTLFLSQLTKTKKVYAFDIQAQAITSTKNLLQKNEATNVELIHDSHVNLDKYIADDEKISAAIFNLGYLPRGDKSIITKPESTIEAILKLQHRLKVGGRIVIVVYPGHEGGAIEEKLLINFVKSFEQEYFEVLQYQFINQKNNPPFILAIEKRKEEKRK